MALDLQCFLIEDKPGSSKTRVNIVASRGSKDLVW